MDYYWLPANLFERILLRLVIHAKLHVEFFDIICINVSTKMTFRIFNYKYQKKKVNKSDKHVCKALQEHFLWILNLLNANEIRLQNRSNLVWKF